MGQCLATCIDPDAEGDGHQQGLVYDPDPPALPTGLYPNQDHINVRQMRKLILQGKLAPCYRGKQENENEEVRKLEAPALHQSPFASFQAILGAQNGECLWSPQCGLVHALDIVLCASQLEECPICFLYYPALNQCECTMGICTECYMQVSLCWDGLREDLSKETIRTCFSGQSSLHVSPSDFNVHVQLIRHRKTARCPICQHYPLETTYKGLLSAEQGQKAKEEREAASAAKAKVIDSTMFLAPNCYIDHVHEYS